MIISRFSLVAVSLLFGRHMDAQEGTSTPATNVPSPTTPSSPAPTSLAPITPIATASSPSATYFPTNWTLSENPVILNQLVNYTYEYKSPILPLEPIYLYLCQSTGPVATQDNTFLAVSIPVQDVSFTQNDPVTIPIQLESATTDTNALAWPFFLCWGVGTNSPTSIICESFSDSFMISDNKLNPAQISPRAASAFVRDIVSKVAIPQVTLSVTKTTQVVSISGFPFPSITRTTTSTGTPTGTATTTITASPTSTPTSSAQSGSKSSLSTGPIVGIAVGGFALVLAILLLAFFCVRRSRRNAPPQPEHVLLTQSMHSGSRDLGGEKEGSIGVLGSILETRPSSGPYDHLSSSAPYTGPAGNIRRQPTVGTMNTSLSRAISNVSGPVSPRSTARGAEPALEEPYHEPYQDVPVYGETRHTPQLYQGALQAPFLSEPGMTDEELLRLEEEERRIDAAIAEAEGRR